MKKLLALLLVAFALSLFVPVSQAKTVKVVRIHRVFRHHHKHVHHHHHHHRVVTTIKR